MFIALPAAYGVATAWLVERAYARGLKIPGAIALVVLLAPLLTVGLGGIVVVIGVGLVVVAVLAANRTGFVGGLVRSSPVAWVARGGIALLFALASVALYRDVSEVL